MYVMLILATLHNLSVCAIKGSNRICECIVLRLMSVMTNVSLDLVLGLGTVCVNLIVLAV